MKKVFIVGIALGILGACSPRSDVPVVTTPSSLIPTTSATVPVVSTYPTNPIPGEVGFVSPNNGIPAGSVDPSATVDKVCTVGYTKTIRPSSSYTTAMKIRQLATLGYTDQDPKDYEEDHMIPLELGGNPTDPNNLWPQLWGEAHKKDAEENRLHSLVCSGSMTLEDAQKKILDDWGQHTIL